MILKLEFCFSPYHMIGFPRIAYLPNNDAGQKILRLLKRAFDQRLVFTVGTSSTTGNAQNVALSLMNPLTNYFLRVGMGDCVIWNDIHHKTSLRPHAAHGYPDPGYLANIEAELAQHGITE